MPASPEVTILVDNKVVKGLIVYFSQGGTTRQVADAIATGLRKTGCKIDLWDVKNGHPPSLDQYNFLGIGFPVHFYRPPFNVTDYLNSLPNLEGLAVFVFVLYGTYRGDAGTLARRVLARNGGREVGYLFVRGADRFLGYTKRGYLFSPNSPTAKDLTEAKAFGRQIVPRLTGQEYIQPAEDESPAWIYRLERFVTNRWFVKQVFGRLFKVKADQCTACGLCMTVCPTGNIHADDEGHPVWNRNCLLCLYCEMKCPKGAITSPVGKPIFQPFMAYNVWRAARDATLDYVILKRGE